MEYKDIDFEKLSPMMQHYVSIKKQYPDCLIMYRLGDFYEMFFQDAETGSKVLELALTGRACGLEERAPMCGVPHYDVESRISKLVESGYKVAVVDQMEDPSQATGLVKRSVTRIITPGTLVDVDSIDRAENNYLMSVYVHKNSVGICYADITTGEIKAAELISVNSLINSLSDWITTLSPSEILFSGDSDNLSEITSYTEQKGIFITKIDTELRDMKDIISELEKYLSKKELRNLKTHIYAAAAASSLMGYVYTFREESLTHLNKIEWVETNKVLKLNSATRENLEIHHNLNDHTKKHSLTWILDHTETAMGSRRLTSWLEFPLVSIDEINERLSIVEYFVNHVADRITVRESLSHIYDLERLLSKLSYNHGNARDLLAFAYSVEPIPRIRKSLIDSNFKPLMDLAELLDPLDDLVQSIKDGINENAPLVITEGDLIKRGYSKELDELKYGAYDAFDRIREYEKEQRELTGIKTLRIVDKKNAGYFIEVTNSYLDKVPETYKRRQTLKNAERFVTDELEFQVGKILNNKQKIFQIEYEIFQNIRSMIADNAIRIQQTANEIARLDVILSFAHIADENHYSKPIFEKNHPIEIINGRHPVVEKTMNGQFIPNDLSIGYPDNIIQIITGPNMAGKSTYMRQNALIIIMAQIGSFVPCDKCILPITDQIFTRIGAADNLANGDSTFMIEMKEMANILKYATKSSFLVLDEVGRGTSTNDGLSIAYAIVEYLSKKVKAKTLFATHYHELTSLSKDKNNIKNRKVDIQEHDGGLVFLRKVVEGTADKSYGIEVARLSGLPEEILKRSKFILQNIDSINDVSFVEKAQEEKERQQDFSDFQKDMLLKNLSDIDINDLSPIKAMNILDSMIKEAKELFRKDR